MAEVLQLEQSSPVDLAQLEASLRGPIFAGVRLTEVIRARIFALVSQLVAKGQLTDGVLLRYLPPLLRGLSESPAEFDAALRQLLSRMAQEPDSRLASVPRYADPSHSERTTTSRPRRRWLRLLWWGAFILVTSGLLAVGYFASNSGARRIFPQAAPQIDQSSAVNDDMRSTEANAPQSGAANPTQQGDRYFAAPPSAQSIDQQQWPWWISPAVLSLIAAITVFVLLASLRHLPLMGLRSRHGGTPRVSARAPVDSAAELNRKWLMQWRGPLTRPIPGEPALDLEASVRATAAANGFGILQFGSRRSPPNYLVAIERRGARDAQASWLLRILSELKRSGLAIQITTFRRSALMSGFAIDMDWRRKALMAGPGATALVFGDLNDREIGVLRKQTSEAPALIVIQPGVPHATIIGARNDPGRERVSLAKSLGRVFDERDQSMASASYLFDRQRNWLDETPMDDVGYRHLRGALTLQLGEDGLRWLSGCAMFPMVDAATIWQVATTLELDKDSNAVRLLATRVFAMPWMRVGWFPRWLRVRLLEDLGERDLGALHEAICGSLYLANGPDAKASAAYIGRASPAIALTEDTVFARFVIDRARLSALDSNRLPRELRRILLPSPWQLLQSRAAVRLIMLPMLWGVLSMLTVSSFVPLDLVWRIVGLTAFAPMLALAFPRIARVASGLPIDPRSLPSLRGQLSRAQVPNRAAYTGNKSVPIPDFLRRQVIERKHWTSAISDLLAPWTSAISGVLSPLSPPTVYVRDRRRTLDFQLRRRRRGFVAFEGLGWMATSLVIALGSYMVTSQVSADRARLGNIEKRIVDARSDIRNLETEFATRANLAQLEKWNAEGAQLTTPGADKYLSTGALADLQSGNARFDQNPRVLPQEQRAQPRPKVTNGQR